MAAADVRILLVSGFWDENVRWLSALLALALALALATVVDRAFRRRGARLARTLAGGPLSREIDTS